MCVRFGIGLVLASLFLTMIVGRTAQAQGFFPFFPGYSYGDPYASGRPRYQRPVARRPAYRERRGHRSGYAEERRARHLYRTEREARGRRHLRPVPAVEARKAQPAKPAVEPSTYIVVFGDSLAELVSDGLDEAYDEAPEIEVVSKAKSDSGLVRNDLYDWPKAIQEYLNTNPKITFAVMMAGVNDRQAIREGDVTHDPLSDRWRDIYGDRVDAVARAFAERKVPLIWVGMPPVKNEKFSADLTAINEIVRERVQKAGAVYVDIGPGFINDQNRYAPVGPDVAGQTAKLRASDGIHFTEAGARKAAHFVEIEIKRLLEARPGANVAATAPAAKDVQPAPAAGSPAPAAKPAAGPVLPLTRVDVSPDGVLLTSRPRADGDSAADRAYRQGVLPGPKPGRADDFKWPRS